MDSPLKYHGGKSYLAKDLIELFPIHKTYAECCVGGGSILMQKDPFGVAEVVNDIDGWVSNFWRVLCVPTSAADFIQKANMLPFSRELWEFCYNYINSRPDGYEASGYDDAIKFFVLCRQSLAGRQEEFATLSKTRLRRGMNEQVSAWLNAVDGLGAVHERLRRVVVERQDIIEFIDDLDHSETFFYIDPPYLPSTRAAKQVYRYEMTLEKHETLLKKLGKIKGNFMLSGYRSSLYDAAAEHFGWKRLDFDTPNHAAHTREASMSKRIMTECIWINY